MAIFRPDEYQHRNADLAFVDSTFVRGGRRTVADRAGLYALARKPDQLKEQVTIVRVLSENADQLLVSLAQAGVAAGWQAYAVPAAPGGAAYNDGELRGRIGGLETLAPSAAEKAALDAGDAPTASNPYVTQSKLVWVVVGDKANNNIAKEPLKPNTTFIADANGELGLFGNTFGFNIYACAFTGVIQGNTFEDTQIGLQVGTYFTDNYLGASGNNNHFGGSCSFNTIGANVDTVYLGTNCSGNTVAAQVSGVDLGDNCRDNTIGAGCSSVSLGAGCERVELYNCKGTSPDLAGRFKVAPGTKDAVYRNNVLQGSATGGGTAITESTVNFFTATSAAAKSLFGTAGLSLHAALEALAAAIGGGGSPAAPTISNVSPNTGAVGDVVTITGTGYGASQATTSTVKFNGLLAYPTAWSATSLTVPVPTGATSGSVTVTTAGGTATSSSAFTVSTATPGQPVVLTPQTSTYGLNVLNRADSAGNVQRSYCSYLSASSDNSALTLNLTNTEAPGNAQPSSVTILQAGQPAQTVRPTGSQGATNYNVTLLGVAPYQFRVILGTLERANEQGDILGRVVNALSFPAGTTATFVAPSKKSECVIFITDSIGTGTGSSTPEIEGWLPKLRALDTGRDYLNDGYQSRQMRVAVGSSAAITTLNDEIAQARAGYTTATQALCLGTNDYDQTPASLATDATNWLTATRARFPNDRLLVASPIVANSAYASESNLPAIRTALQNAVASSGLSNVGYVDGLQLLGDNTQLSDGVHPTANGHTIIAGNWLQQLQATQGGVSTTVDNSNIVYSPNAAAFKLFHNTTTPTPNYLMSALNYVNDDPTQGAITGSSVNVYFNGTQAKVDYHLEAQGTVMEVLIDDQVVGTINQYNPIIVANYHYLTPAVAAGNHKLTLRKQNDNDTTKIFWYEGLTFYGGTGIIAQPAGSYEAESTAFFTRHTSAGGNLSTSQKNSVDTFVKSLKAANIYAKMKEFGLLIGGTAATHALGFFNVANTTWTGNITHSATGALGDGSSGYGNLGLNPASGTLALNSAHLSYYSRQDRGNTQSEREMGVADEQTGATATRILLNIQGGLRMDLNTVGNMQTPPASTAGYFVTSRTAAAIAAGYRNGTKLYDTTAGTSALPNGLLLLLAQGDLTGAPAGYSTKECCFWSAGAGLSASEVSTLSTAVQQLQSNLGRAV